MFVSEVSLKNYRVHGRNIKNYRQTDRSTKKESLFWILEDNKNVLSSKGDFFPYYNNISFYILRRWWESKKKLRQRVLIFSKESNTRVCCANSNEVYVYEAATPIPVLSVAVLLLLLVGCLRLVTALVPGLPSLHASLMRSMRMWWLTTYRSTPTNLHTFKPYYCTIHYDTHDHNTIDPIFTLAWWQLFCENARQCYSYRWVS